MTPTSTNATRSEPRKRKHSGSVRELDRSTAISLVSDDTITGVSGLSSPLTFEPRLRSAVLKRGIDIVGAAIALLISAPFIALIAVAIKLESPGPVFFSHRRLGRNGQLFDCWKFRSMHDNAERRLHSDDALRHSYISNHFKIPSHLDPRITRVGRLLRMCSLDELPQLWNVLCGDMSLVGPRPIVPLESSYYGEELPVLLSVRPGLTGAWAVNGRSSIGYPMRATIELEYVRNWSLGGDMRILVRTPRVVVSQRGAY